MARIYAGILGILAMLTALARGALLGGGSESLLWSAWFSLWVFAAIGYIAGRLGDWVVQESVETRIAAEIAAEEANQLPTIPAKRAVAPAA